MEQIERYVKEVLRGLRVPEPLRRQLAEELRAHLLESVQARVDAGMAEEEAVAEALTEFGQADVIRGELKSAYGGNLLTLLVQRAMDWREKTMKTEWKWGFVAQVALVIVLAVGYLALLGWVRYLVPILVEGYNQLNAPPTHLGLGPALLRFCAFLEGTWWVWPVLLALGWAIFEWRYKSEGKGTIRLAAESLASLAMIAVVCLFSTVAMITYGDLMARSQWVAGDRLPGAVAAKAPPTSAQQLSAPSGRQGAPARSVTP